MRIRVLQHVAFENAGSIVDWAADRDWPLEVTHLYQGEIIPPVNTFDWLVVMGGPMSIDETDLHPWLVAERALIDQAVRGGKTVLGICLGAQLLADVLGARVSANGVKEIGWFPVKRDAAATGAVACALPDESEVFHWHGDTFDLPDGSQRLASSEACSNQGFVLEDRVVGLQFHMETRIENARLLIEHGADELIDAPTVQPAEAILADPRRFAASNATMTALLDALAAASRSCPGRM